MMKYKVGDKVRVREDLRSDTTWQDGIHIADDMAKKRGRIVTIRDVFSDNGYEIDEDNGLRYWTESMFEDVEENLTATSQKFDKHDNINGLTNTDALKPDYYKYRGGDVFDMVNHPSHYTDGKIEVIDFIEDKKLGYHLGNACKYISRCRLKNDGRDKVQDLRKAIWYIERQIYLWEKAEG